MRRPWQLFEVDRARPSCGRTTATGLVGRVSDPFPRKLPYSGPQLVDAFQTSLWWVGGALALTLLVMFGAPREPVLTGPPEVEAARN